MNKIKDVAMWEETDSELVKYHIQQAINRIRDLKEQMTELFDEYFRLNNRINKAIEYIEKEVIDDEIEYNARLLDILKGSEEDED